MSELKPFDINFSGINLIEASAGTGKTYNITSLYIRAIIEKDIPVGKILVVTYTEAATKELKDRLLNRMRISVKVLKKGEVENKSDQFLQALLQNTDNRKQAVERLQKAIRSFDESAIYTIHGFCYQALQEQAFESRAMYDAEMIGDDSELVIEAVEDYWRKWVAEASNHPEKKLLLNILLDQGYHPEKLAGELGAYLGQPYLEVLPKQTPSIEEIVHKIEELRTIFEEIQKVWFEDRDQILSLLLGDALNGHKYRKDYLANWFGYMDAFLESEFMDIKPFDQFSNFATSTLVNNLNKGYDQIPSHSIFGLVEQYLNTLQSVLRFEITFKKDLLVFLKNELKQKKEMLQVLSYDDLLLRLREALVENERGPVLAAKFREKYPIAMVDEFQDTDPNQYDIFRTIYKNTSEALFMIGDPKQSIYSFRGADVFSYLKAKQDALPENTYELEHNFRSTPKLLKALNTFFGDHDNPFILDRIPYESVKQGWDDDHYNTLFEYGKQHPPIRFRPLLMGNDEQLSKGDAADRIAQNTAKEIYELIKGGKAGNVKIGSEKVEARDIAVLVRTHDQATLISDVLHEKGIKSVQYSQESVFNSDEAQQLETLLKAVVEPQNEHLITTALALPLTSYTARDLIDLRENEERWVAILDQFAEWQRIWQEKGFSPMFRSLLKKANISEHLIGYSDGERRVTNMLHLGELMQTEARRQKDGMRGLIKWLAQKRQQQNGEQDEEQLRLESDQELVKIITMHRSKGLEYPIVFCPFLWYGPRFSDSGKPLVYHDPKDLDRIYLDLNGKTDDDRNDKRRLVAWEDMAESLRLAYVAMTRAIHCCYISWAYARKSEFSPLGYLLSDPAKTKQMLKDTIANKYKAVGNQLFEDRMQQFCEKNPTLFTMEATQVSKMESQQLELRNQVNSDDLQPVEFTRATPLKLSYSVSSFSSLSSWMEEDDPDVPDYDQFLDYDYPEENIVKKPEKRSMFTFPKGPQPGTCIHNIFESIDFNTLSDADEVIDRQLEKNGIDPKWKEIVLQMLKKVVNKSLHPDEKRLKLFLLEKKDMVPEMEFYYKNDEVETEKLLSIIRQDDHSSCGQEGKAEPGFLKGFIDLTFKFDGKYYLLDYKTNYLGDDYSNYVHQELALEMREAFYDLQYHIYSVALHRFLQRSLKEKYSYEKHFGGAFYLFLRGINEEGDEGIFFDRPDKQVITKLDDYIRGGAYE